jgi:hypothetical protein
MRKFARQCSITGEGMNEGWCFGDGQYYVKHENDALALALKYGYNSIDDAFEDDAVYWTEWEDEDDYQYYEDENGKIFEISFELPNILKEDYVLWNIKNNCPVEGNDIVYHYTALIELFNNGMHIEDDEEFVCIKSIPLRWQILYNAEIERSKELLNT